jgi:hypothetical protein
MPATAVSPLTDEIYIINLQLTSYSLEYSLMVQSYNKPTPSGSVLLFVGEDGFGVGWEPCSRREARPVEPVVLRIGVEIVGSKGKGPID